MIFKLPELNYSYDALEPHIDKQTMEIHHTKHHQAYVDKLNQALEKYPEFQNMEIEEILKSLDKLPEDIKTAVRNNGGGHYNHDLFWKIMSPDGERKPVGELAKKIDEKFGDIVLNFEEKEVLLENEEERTNHISIIFKKLYD